MNLERDHVENVTRSFVWTLVPLVTFGLANPLVFGLGAIMRRSGRLALFALGYLGVIGVEVLAIWAFTPPIEDVLFWLGVLVSVPGAFVHALLIRRWVWDLPKRGERREPVEEVSIEGSVYGAPSPTVPMPTAAHGNGYANQGNGYAPHDPAPYANAYPLNFNHASATEIQHVTGLPMDHAEHIVRVRANVGGFQSLDHLTYTTGLPHGLLNHVAGRVQF